MAKRKTLLKALIVLALAASGVALFLHLTFSKERPSRRSKPDAAPVVEGVRVEQRDVPITVEAMGEVLPARSVRVVPEVSGRVVAMNPNLIPGGVIKKNHILFRIDPSDFDLALKEQEGAVAEARFRLEEQEGQRMAAQRELQMVDEELAPTAKGLRLAGRESHIENATAQLEAAKSRMDKVRLNRRRTVLRAPFDVRVVEENIDTGQVVSTQSQVAVLVDAHEAWIEATLPVDRLEWIDIPTVDSEEGSKVVVTQRVKGGREARRPGRVLRLLPGLEDHGKLARLLIAVKDPFEPVPESQNDPLVPSLPLLLGSFVHVEIQGRTIPDLITLPRAALREGDQVWVRDDAGRLAIRKVEQVWGDEKTVHVRGELEPGETVVVSRLTTPVPGMALSLGTTPSSVRAAAIESPPPEQTKRIP